MASAYLDTCVSSPGKITSGIVVNDLMDFTVFSKELFFRVLPPIKM
jgi:hypothetical protein